jgi:hypothetical protein
MEIDISNFSGDSVIRHGGIWNCGGTAPLVLNYKLYKRRGSVSSGAPFTQRKKNPVYK